MWHSGLHHPSDWKRLSSEAIRDCNILRNNLRLQPDAAPAQQLRWLDGISNTVCSVIDAAELCRNVHASEIWRGASEGAFGELAGYIGELNADTTMYGCLRGIVEDSAVFSALCEEDQLFAVALKVPPHTKFARRKGSGERDGRRRRIGPLSC